MRKFFYIAVLAVLTACTSNNNYSKLLKAEKEEIARYIKSNNIKVIYEEPDEDYEWADNEYYQIAGRDNLYFHLVKRGNKEAGAVEPTETVILRYRQYTLKQPADTASFWTTLEQPYPVEFQFLTDYTNASVGWQEAVRLMKYTDAECKLICPSKLGFTAEQTSVTPYGYDMKIKIKR